jgi:hypothetical protein
VKVKAPVHELGKDMRSDKPPQRFGVDICASWDATGEPAAIRVGSRTCNLGCI